MHIAALFTEFAVTAPAAFVWLAAQWQSFAAIAGSALISSIWQGAVIVCTLEIATRLMPRISAAHRFVLWSAGFVLSLALPLLALIQFDAISTPSLASGSGISPAVPRALLQLDSRWGVAIAALWAIASLIRAADLAVHSIRLRRLWKAAQPVEITSSLSAELNSLRRGLVAVCTTQLLDRPSVIGFLAPRILIPHWLLSRLTAGELEQIVLHEAEHLRRRDDWTNLFQKLCLVVFPLNLALAWIEHHLCAEREMACDEGVIRITNAPRAYAACLASLAERRLERRAEALSLGAWHRRSELVHRVHRILVHQRTMSRTAAATLVATLGSMLLAGSVEMSRFPQLVAFVPRHSTQAMTTARQAQLNALLANQTSESKLALLPGYRALPAKAVLPDAHLSAAAHVRKRASANTSTHKEVAASSQQLAKADQTGDRVLSSQPQSQQWVVVAAWEEVSTVSRVPQTISDFEPQNNQPANDPTSTSTVQNSAAFNATSVDAARSGQASAPAQTRTNQNHPTAPAHRFTVTQLILRVIPATPGSSSTQPATIPVRDGWFVIQL